ncbi:uncharacterized protein M6B38_174700 [Iris pallida]|uniref:SWIM-type domain-containing protein n=1 Tax=Iris pallida TaxID=29817 RepID=A0AAX6EQJ6_IRIPA|nr:uncharacterized protein M6B38_174700 [Iris pallida]
MDLKIRQNENTWTPTAIIDEIWHNFQVKISYHVAWAGRCKVIEKVNGSYAESYGKLPQLCNQILLSNRQNIATCSRDVALYTFNSLCIAYKASMDGFISGCRPIIGLDGCFLKGKYGGALLAATSLDARNGLFPLAIYICRSEDTNNWTNFLEQISGHLIRHPLRLTFISDRQKGLIQAVSNVFPESNHRFCFRHMFKNFKKKYSGKMLESIVWKAAKAYKINDFRNHMEELQMQNKDAYDYLMNEDVCTWARAHFDHTTKSEHITNNFSESFNNWIIKLRDKPILMLAKKYHTMMMTMFHKRRNLGNSWDENELVPTAVGWLDKMRGNMKDFVYRGSDGIKWEVENCFNSTWIVDVEARTCSCVQWQLSGFPCMHAIVILHSLRVNWPDFCHECYTVRAYRRSYAGAICPLEDIVDWGAPDREVLPPITKRPPGRPRMARRRDADEPAPRKQRRCGNCHQLGHNKKRCNMGGTRSSTSTRKKVKTRGASTQSNQNGNTE